MSLLCEKALVFWMDWSQTYAGNLANLTLSDLFLALDDQFSDVDRERRLQYKFDNLVQKNSVS